MVQIETSMANKGYKSATTKQIEIVKIALYSDEGFYVSRKYEIMEEIKLGVYPSYKASALIALWSAFRNAKRFLSDDQKVFVRLHRLEE